MTQDPSAPGADGELPFQVVVEALRRNDNAAWNDLLRRYSARLVALARSRLFDGRLRQKLDPEDVVQSVFRTFFRRHAEGKFTLNSWEDLWGLLVTLTVYRTCKWHQHYAAQKRDLRREVGTPAESAGSDDDDAPDAQLADPGPTPLEVLLFKEVVEQTLKGLDENQRRIIEMGLQGLDDAEISQESRRTEYRVRQVREEFAEEMRRLVEREAGAPAP